MLQYEVAKQIYQEITEKAATTYADGFEELYELFIWRTLVYANTLTVWSRMNSDEKASYQAKKEEEFLEYAVKLYQICIELDVDIFEDVLDDEEERSDFACYVQLFISLDHRNS